MIPMELEYFRPSGTNSSVNMAILAIMTALTIVMTIVFQVPYPGTEGYFNLGDIMVMLSGLLLGPIGGFIAGGGGSALADIASGWAHYAPITLIVVSPFSITKRVLRIIPSSDTIRRVSLELLVTINATSAFDTAGNKINKRMIERIIGK